MQTPIPRIDIITLSEHREEDIMISRFGEYLKIHPNLVSPHRHSFYHLLFFTRGAGTHTIDFNYFDVTPHQIYFMLPGQVHAWNFEGEVDGYVVNFSPAFFQSFLLRPEYLERFSFWTGSTAESVINLSNDEAGQVFPLFEELLRQYQGMAVFREDMIRIVLLKLFVLVEQGREPNDYPHPTSRAQMLLKKFQHLVDKNFVDLKQPGAYAELLSITPNHLNALCKEHLGLQAGEVIRQRLTLEAKRLLVNMELTVSEIAYHLNFSDNSYFTRFFRKQTGITPEVFRKRALVEKS
jgi:AraC family transcriptional activator of pobA